MRCFIPKRIVWLITFRRRTLLRIAQVLGWIPGSFVAEYAGAYIGLRRRKNNAVAGIG